MLVNEYRLEIHSRKFKIYEILITFQRSGPDHWNVSLRITYEQNGLDSLFKRQKQLKEVCACNVAQINSSAFSSIFLTSSQPEIVKPAH
jgi:hypothetical protein